MQIVKRPEIRITLIYLVTGIIWIIFSDKYFLNVHGITPLQLTHFQTEKGFLFVILTGALMYFLIRRSNKKCVAMQDEYDQLFQDNPNPMWIIDLETSGFLKVNKAAITLYGYSEQEFLSMNVNDITAPDELKKLSDGSKKISEAVTIPEIYKQRKKDGSILVAKVTMHLVDFYNRKCRLVLSQDVTRKKMLEQDLLQSHSELNVLIKSITDGFYIIDRNFTIIKYNEPLRKLAEIDFENMVGRNLYEVFPSSRNNLGHQKMIKAFNTNQSAHFESYNSRRREWYRVYAYPFEQGLCIFFRDITREKENELKLIQSEQNLNALINNTEDLIWSVDTDLKYHIYNKKYEQEYRQFFNEDIWPGKTALSQTAGSDYTKKWKELYERALTGEVFSIDMGFNYPDGRLRYACIRFNPIADAENKIVGIGCFLQDITQNKIHTEKIEQQNKKLRDIAFTTSHTVRAPLANLLGLTEALDKKDLTNPTNLQIVEYIKTSSQQLDRVIKDIVHKTVQIEEEIIF